ncbi:unnamed protein product [Cunninghamella echinulata]
MNFITLLSVLLIVFMINVFADTTYIMGIKKDQSNKETLERAKQDIQAAHGEILHEFKTGMKGYIISMPDDQFSALEAKDYVDFIEADQEVHIL